MIQPIMKDIFFLQQKSEPATQLDVQVGQDLQDTLAANAHACVGMAANMIGVKKRIIIVNMGFTNLVMSSARPSPIRQKRAACRWKVLARRHAIRRLKWSFLMLHGKRSA